MKKDEVFRVIAHKLGINAKQLETQQIEGKIHLPYLQSIFNDVKKRLREDRTNGECVDEFSQKSKDPWAYFKPDITVLMLARLLTCYSGRTASKVRAECTRPRITASVLWEFLAVQMETTADQLAPDMKVREIRLPVAGNDKHSWLTFVIWADNIFGDGHLADKPENIVDLSVEELFRFWTRP